MTTDNEIRRSIPSVIIIATNDLDLARDTAEVAEAKFPGAEVRCTPARQGLVQGPVLFIDVLTRDESGQEAPFCEIGDRAHVIETIVHDVLERHALQPTAYIDWLRQAMMIHAHRVAGDAGREVSAGDSWTHGDTVSDSIRGVFHQRPRDERETDLALMVLTGHLYRVANSYRLTAIGG